MEENVRQKIEAYLGGDMSPEEQRQFEEIISQNPELQTQIRLSNEINHHLNQDTWLELEKDSVKISRKELDDYIKSEDAKSLKLKLKQTAENYKKQRSSVRIRYIISSAAAILVLGLISILFWNQTPNHNLLYDEYYIETDLPSVVKRGSEDDLLMDGVTAFKTKDYKKSITLFEDYMEKTQNNDPLIYAYIGFSHIEMGETDMAILNFDKLLKSNSIDNSRGLWYKSLAYLKTNKIEKSKEILSKIIKDSLNFNYNKAKELWKEIN